MSLSFTEQLQRVVTAVREGTQQAAGIGALAARLGLGAAGLGDGEAARAVLALLLAINSAHNGPSLETALENEAAPRLRLAPPGDGFDVRVFTWTLSYFSGKVRGYLRYKARTAGLRFEEVLATPLIVGSVLVPATHSNTVPQLQLPSGVIVHDSSEIIEHVERLFPTPAILPDAGTCPCQKLTCLLLELLGDEWLLVAAYHWRWAYSGDGSAAQQLNVPPLVSPADKLGKGSYAPAHHRAFNEQQWGDFIMAHAPPKQRREAAKILFDTFMFRTGPKAGLVALGVTDSELASAWEGSTMHVLAVFEVHLEQYPFVLGHRPSLADYGLLGPLYAHLYRDPVPGFMMKTRFPNVAAWCERVHDRGGELHEQARYDFDQERGELRPVAKPPEQWPADDVVPPTITPLLRVFFAEMWPVLQSTMRGLTSYLATGQHGSMNSALPSKSFTPTILAQMGTGSLTHTFRMPLYDTTSTVDAETLASAQPTSHVDGRRMLVPYQVWMLQKVSALVSDTDDAGRAALHALLANTAGDVGLELLQLPRLLEGCRVRKVGGNIYPAATTAAAAAATTGVQAKL